ncbi:hypothetical protein [Streptomyces violascens]|uniref:hypothetical protein n=1 Tax=Streptomyces violascens TaxID=67381 RepID=UPI001677BC9E|nr:hypothetical protein [Streptomyces violascens]GGU49426.1 hypothetical protein GCM10010289_82430 [Streptomyces violascens]
MPLSVRTPLVSRAAAALHDHAARALIFLAGHAARSSRVPNPVAATRLVLVHIADQNKSGADTHMEITSGLANLGFAWPAGWCNGCNVALTEDQAEDGGLCDECAPWLCACAFENPGAEVQCGGCHLTRSGLGQTMPPCTCGCDTSFGEFGDYDTESSVSRQHFADTGRFLRPGETLNAG